jgi:23S rRNA (pseudouridine1915-N3)-methyltransferase
MKHPPPAGRGKDSCVRIHLIAAGNRMPEWVNMGYGEFAGRMPPECRLHLIEIPLPKRAKGHDTSRLIEQEGERMLAAVPKGSRVVTLEVTGKEWSTEELAAELGRWLQEGRDIALLVGGPDGLAPACAARAETRWSLSRLTLPHMLVRIVAAEQLYRAWSFLHGHPYHRGAAG